jgi:cytosine/adenosine deaminase-related metal-dependent hydrolase
MVNNKKIVRGKNILIKSGAQRKIITDGAIYIEKDLIKDIGNYEDVSNTYDCDLEIGSKENAVIPGFVNSHHHGRGLSLLQTGVRDGPLELWITHHLRKAYKPNPYYNTLLTCINQIESGITTSLHHVYGHDPYQLFEYEKAMEEVIRAHIDSGMRVALAPSIQDQDKFAYVNSEDFNSQQPKRIKSILGIHNKREEEISQRVNNYFQVFSELHQKYNNYQGRIKLLLGPTGVHWCSDDLLQRIKEKAKKLHVGIHMHLQESKYQRDYGYIQFNKSPLEHLSDLDFLGPEVSFAHCVWMPQKDIELLYNSKSIVVHNPSSNLRLFNGVAPIPSMIEKGVNIALGIDGTGLNDNEDMFQEMRLCSIIHREPKITNYELYKRTLLPSKILDLATIQGAKATGNSDNIGTIQIGKKADLVLINLSNIQQYLRIGIPFEEIIINWGKRENVDTVIINGEIILKNKKFIKIDKTEALRLMFESIRKVDQELDQAFDVYQHNLMQYYKEWDKNE